MANIRNSISLTDRMTPTLRSILKAMDSTLRVMEKLDKASNNGVQSKAYKRAEKDIQRANNALIKMSNHNKMVANTARDSERAYARMGNTINSVANGMKALGSSSTGFLQSLASGVYLAEKIANTVSGIMTTADTARSQVARLGLYNTSEYTNEELYGQVFRTAMNTRSGLSTTADLTNKLLISGVFSGETAPQSAIGTAGLINKALVAGGGTSEENERALRQLTQGLASGVLQGDELRSIREQTPYFAQVLAEGLAQVDEKFAGIGIGDLKRLGAEGELTADRIIKAMWAMQDEIDEDFGAMPKTFGQAVTSMQNVWQYFLWMLSDAEGPLGKINARLWQFVDYLQSPQGLELLETVATGIDVVATALSYALGAAGSFVTFLQENVPIAQALFMGLGAAAVAAGLSAAASWIAVAWPMLLLIGVVALVSYAFLDAGYTMSEIIGAVAGAVCGAIGAIWNMFLSVIWLAMTAVAAAATVVVGFVTGVILIIQVVIQLFTWLIMCIITLLWGLLTVVKSIGLLALMAVQTFTRNTVTEFHSMAQSLLDILSVVANAIDAVFGTSLQDGVEGWSSDLWRTYHTVMDWVGDPDITMDALGQMWEDYGSGVKNMFTSDDHNLYDEIDNVLNGAGELIWNIWDLRGKGTSLLEGAMADPKAMFDSGYQWGSGLVDSFGGMELGIPDTSVLDGFYAGGIPPGGLTSDGTLGGGGGGVTVDGGYLDGIKSDVDISEEDLQLLRDMAARDYLLQLQTITPVANVTFGDVRETADVNKIMDVIESMVEEQMATALVS